MIYSANASRVDKLVAVYERLSSIAGELHDAGFLVDEERRRDLSAELWGLHLARKGKLLSLVKSATFDGTPDELRALIFERHRRSDLPCFGLPDPEDPKLYTDDTLTKCKVNKEALLRIIISPRTPPELAAIIDAYWHCHAPRKARATYVESSKVLQAIGRDGRLRAGWNSCGTETMRWSCSSPNLMNLSEKKEADTLQGELPNIRSMYCVPEGRVLVHADYSQQELRIMAAVSGDKALKAALETGDVYSYDARQWFKLGADYDVKKEKPSARKCCKIIHLAFQYAASTGAVFTQALIQDRKFKYALARELHTEAKTLYAGTVEYWGAEHARVCASGFSEGRIIGNRRYYPREPPPTETANYPVQTTAGELTALSMIELRDRMRHDFPTARIITILHDAFDVEADEDDAFGVAQLMDEVMSQPRKIGAEWFPFPVDVKVGVRWADV